MRVQSRVLHLLAYHAEAEELNAGCGEIQSAEPGVGRCGTLDDGVEISKITPSRSTALFLRLTTPEDCGNLVLWAASRWLQSSPAVSIGKVGEVAKVRVYLATGRFHSMCCRFWSSCRIQPKVDAVEGMVMLMNRSWRRVDVFSRWAVHCYLIRVLSHDRPQMMSLIQEPSLSSAELRSLPLRF